MICTLFLKKENPSLIYIHNKLRLESRPHGDEQTKVRSRCSVVSSGDVPAGSPPALPAKARGLHAKGAGAPRARAQGWPAETSAALRAVTASSTPGARCSAARGGEPSAGGPPRPADARGPFLGNMH